MTDPTRRLVCELLNHRTTNGSSSVEVRTEELTTTLTLVGGVVVSVTASKPGDPLGRVLVRKGLLTQEQYVDVLERMSSALAIGERIRFGEVAVELGFVQAEGVRECLAEQLRLLALRAFQHASPTWTASDIPVGRDTSYDVSMPVEALFLDAVRWVDDARKGALALDEARDLALRPAWSLEEIDARFDLTSDEAVFMRRALGGDKTVAELLDDGSTPDTVDAHAIITALVAAGAASTHTRGLAVRHPASVRPGARKVPPPLPDWAIDASSTQSALARIVLAKVSVPAPAADAFRTLEQQLRSEQAFLRGKGLLRLGRTEAAGVELARALELKPTWAECELFAVWARYAAASDELSPEAQGELRERATIALRENPNLAFGYFVMGEVLRAAGDGDDARQQFRHALRLDPQFFTGARIKRFGGPPTSRASSPDRVPSDPMTSPPPATEANGPTPTSVPIALTPAPPTPAAPTPEDGKPVSAAKAKRRLGSLILALACISAAAALTIGLLERGGDGTGTAVAPPVSPVIASVATAPPAVTAAALARPAEAGALAAPADVAPPGASASVAAVAAGGAPPDADADAAPPIDAQRGVLVLPASAADHRVFVDGRVTVVTSSRITLACGHHEVRIGSQGRTIPVDVSCGRETALP